MMRIITPQGVLQEVVKVVPICEKRLNFNGKYVRMVEPANGIGVLPTALELQFESRKPNDMYMNTVNLFVGNLKPGTVREIQKKLLSDGYFDFSELKYQRKKMVLDTTFDNGESEPYTSDYTLGTSVCQNWGGGIFSQNPSPFMTVPSPGAADFGRLSGDDEWELDDSDIEEESVDEQE